MNMMKWLRSKEFVLSQFSQKSSSYKVEVTFWRFSKGITTSYKYIVPQNVV